MKTQQTNEHIRKQVHAYVDACKPTDTPAQAQSRVTQSDIDKSLEEKQREQSNCYMDENYIHRLQAHAQRLADALKNLAQTVECEPKGSPNISAAIQESYEALAQWEGDKQ